VWAVSRHSEQTERHREDDGLGQKSGLILGWSIADLNCFNLRGEQSDSPTSTDRIYAPGNWVSRAAVQAGFGGHIEGHPRERENDVNEKFALTLKNTAKYFRVCA
jgi:hypothetical protein